MEWERNFRRELRESKISQDIKTISSWNTFRSNSDAEKTI